MLGTGRPARVLVPMLAAALMIAATDLLTDEPRDERDGIGAAIVIAMLVLGLVPGAHALVAQQQAAAARPATGRLRARRRHRRRRSRRLRAWPPTDTRILPTAAARSAHCPSIAGAASRSTRWVTSARGSTVPDSNSATTAVNSSVALLDPRIATSFSTISRASSGTSPLSQPTQPMRPHGATSSSASR